MAASDRDNIRVDRILEGIPDLKALGKVQLERLLVAISRILNPDIWNRFPSTWFAVGTPTDNP